MIDLEQAANVAAMEKHKRLDLLVDIQSIEVRENTRVGQQW